ncbi:MAG TPA: DUF1801 domain-containing protein [Devosia sp.]|nr:DUF1801 domain-containing protein [Devosia sp.]
MAQTQSKREAPSAAEFLAQVEDATQRADSAILVEMMRRVTGEEPRMWGSIVGFGAYHYRYASGRTGDSMVVGFSPRKAEFAIYLHGLSEGEERDALLAKLGKHRMGKGCLYVKKLSAVDLNILEELVRRSSASIRLTYPAQPA